MRSFIIKYKISIIAFLIAIIPGLIIIIITINSNRTHTLKTKTYNITYNSTWNIKSKDDNSIIFKHGKNNKLTIKIIDLDNELAYDDINNIIDVIKNKMIEENKEYKLINEKAESLTKNNYQGYKFLFEKDNYNVISSVYKTEDKLIMFNYSATLDNFDILLDSVNDIIYNFSLKEYKASLGKDLKIDLKEYGNKKYKKLKTKKYTLANSNYEVTINIPNIFKQSYFDNETPSFVYNDSKTKQKVKIQPYIYNINIYDYIKRNNLIKPYKNFKKEASYNNEYKNLKEESFKINKGFLYKESYDYIFATSESIYPTDNYILIYPLDKVYIIKFDIDNNNHKDIENIIKNISISKKTKYSSYTKHKHIKDKITFDLVHKSYYENDNKTTEKRINFQIPDYYKEVECTLPRINEKRCFVYGYNDEKDIYDYNIEFDYHSNEVYESLETKSKKDMDIFYPSEKYGYKNVEKYTRLSNYINKDNNKEFIVYKGSYTDKVFNYGIYTFYNCDYRVLYYYLGDSGHKFDNNGMLKITIIGKDKKIDSKIYEDFVNFTFNRKEY